MQTLPVPAFLPGLQVLKKIKVRLVSLAPDPTRCRCSTLWAGGLGGAGRGHCPSALFCEPCHWAFVHWEGTCLLHLHRWEPLPSAALSALTRGSLLVAQAQEFRDNVGLQLCSVHLSHGEVPLESIRRVRLQHHSLLLLSLPSPLPSSPPHVLQVYYPSLGEPPSSCTSPFFQHKMEMQLGPSQVHEHHIFALISPGPRHGKVDLNRPRCQVLAYVWLALREGTLSLGNLCLL